MGKRKRLTKKQKEVNKKADAAKCKAILAARRQASQDHGPPPLAPQNPKRQKIGKAIRKAETNAKKAETRARELRNAKERKRFSQERSQERESEQRARERERSRKASAKRKRDKPGEVLEGNRKASAKRKRDNTETVREENRRAAAKRKKLNPGKVRKENREAQQRVRDPQTYVRKLTDQMMRLATTVPSTRKRTRNQYHQQRLRHLKRLLAEAWTRESIDISSEEHTKQQEESLIPDEDEAESSDSEDGPDDDDMTAEERSQKVSSLMTFYERQYCRSEALHPCADDDLFDKMATEEYGECWDDLKDDIKQYGSYFEYLRWLHTPRGWKPVSNLFLFIALFKENLEQRVAYTEGRDLELAWEHFIDVTYFLFEHDEWLEDYLTYCFEHYDYDIMDEDGNMMPKDVIQRNAKWTAEYYNKPGPGNHTLTSSYGAQVKFQYQLQKKSLWEGKWSNLSEFCKSPRVGRWYHYMIDKYKGGFEQWFDDHFIDQYALRMIWIAADPYNVLMLKFQNMKSICEIPELSSVVPNDDTKCSGDELWKSKEW